MRNPVSQDTGLDLPNRYRHRAAGLLLALAAGAARADPSGLTLGSGFHLNAQVEAGITGDPARQSGNLNWGQLFTDRNNQLLLNQVLLTLHRDLDPKNPDFQAGLQLQAMYGSDARYTHCLGELDTTLAGRNQLDIVQAALLLHLPVPASGGVDLTLGQFLSPLGYEPIDAAQNPLYTHSYIFNFATYFKATGVLAQWHATPVVTLLLDIDTGANSTFGRGDGDANAAAAGLVGIELSLLGDTLTIEGLSHFGPEDPASIVPNADRRWRVYNDLIVTYKPPGPWSAAAEAAWVHDAYGTAGRGADAGGVALYGARTLSDTVTLNARAELFRDDTGFFVAAFPGDLDYVRAELGQPNTAFGIGPATYGELTVGITWKPAGLPAPLAGLLIRPEARTDGTLTSAKPFQGGRDRASVLMSSDIILQF
jgi:hypothetical protein